MNMKNSRKQREGSKGITLIALVITIIILLILAGISIALLTGENGVLNKAQKAKENHLIEQYKEEINLIIVDEIAERKTQNKEELMIVSLDTKIREKEWVKEIYKCNSNGEEQPTFEVSTHLLVESKEHYEFLIEVKEENQTAKIVSFQKGTGEKYTVTYHPNGGEGQEEVIEVRQGFSITLKDCGYTKEQYKFVGWCENQNGEGERLLGNASYKPEGQVTLYAIWELNVATITLNSNDGTSNAKQVTVTKGKDTKLPENTFIRKGYTFLEWNTKADGSGTKYAEGANINIEQDMSLYAIWKDPSTVEQAKVAGIVLNQNNPTTLTDTYGNIVKVPAGFKIGSESATNVTGGVVIEDVSHTATAGSEFVWIPVGKVYTDEAKTESRAKTINLSRYTFANDGTPTSHGTNTITINMKEQYGSTFPDTNIRFEEYPVIYLNVQVAYNISQFKEKATNSHGYYIGRYDARTSVKAERTSAKKDNGDGVTVKKDDFVYNFVTQAEASRLSRAMYSDTSFKSDLMNSYAWDTAVVFLQTFDNRTNKITPYSKQTTLNTGSLANKGTNHLQQEKQDKICNIWDMASNIQNFTTEIHIDNPDNPCVIRGGEYSWVIGMVRGRHGTALDAGVSTLGFRPLLYL